MVVLFGFDCFNFAFKSLIRMEFILIDDNKEEIYPPPPKPFEPKLFTSVLIYSFEWLPLSCSSILIISIDLTLLKLVMHWFVLFFTVVAFQYVLVSWTESLPAPVEA